MDSTRALTAVLTFALSGSVFSQTTSVGSTTESAPHQYQTNSDHLTSRVQEEASTDQGAGATPSGFLRKVAPFPLSLIEDFEQWVPEPYNDASKYCTIGFGHLIAKLPCTDDLVKPYANPLGIDKGRLILSDDTGLASASVSRWVKVDLNDQQFGALTSFVFNVGSNNFSKSSLLRYVNAGNDNAASREFGKWVMSKHKVLDGLISRRACEAALFMGKIPVGTEKFNRSNCGGLGAAPTYDKLIDIEIGEQ